MRDFLLDFGYNDFMTVDEFQKVDLRVGKVIAAERVESSEKLLKLQVDLGTESRQIVAGIGKAYAPEDLVGKNIVIVANLDPRIFVLRRGSGQVFQSDENNVTLESQGMLLAASDTQGMPVILTVAGNVPPGAGIK